MRVISVGLFLWMAGLSPASATVQISYQAATRYTITDVLTANMDAATGSISIVQTGESLKAPLGHFADPHAWEHAPAGAVLIGQRLDALGNPHLVLGVGKSYAPNLIGHPFTSHFPMFNEQLVLGSVELVSSNNAYAPAVQILLDFATQIIGEGATIAPDGGAFTLISFSDGQAIGSGTASVRTAPPSGSVPEPSAWAMMVLGFGLIGLAARSDGPRISLAPVPLNQMVDAAVSRLPLRQSRKKGGRSMLLRAFRSRLRLLAAGAASIIVFGASTAHASCPIGWSGPCYSAHVETANNLAGPSTYFGETHYGPGPQSAVVPWDPNLLGAYASANSDSADNGTVTAIVRADFAGMMARADADVQYNFSLQAIGSGSAPLVPIHIIASATDTWDMTVSRSRNDYAVFDLEQGGNRVVYRNSMTPFGRQTVMFDIDEWVEVDPTRPFTLYMSATAMAYADPHSDEQRLNSKVVVDPTFEIAPEFANLYRFVGLPSASSGSGSVPEPASWMLMLGGFGCTGGALRRRTSNAARKALSPA